MSGGGYGGGFQQNMGQPLYATNSYNPYAGGQQQQQQTPPQQQMGYNPQVNPDAAMMQNFNKMYGTNYYSQAQIPANDYYDFIQRSGGEDQARRPMGGMPSIGQLPQAPAAPNPQDKSATTASPFAVNRGGADSGMGTGIYMPPKYPTWLYGPTAGLFGGVTPPQGTPQNYGYFPGSQTWGVQPSGGF